MTVYAGSSFTVTVEAQAYTAIITKGSVDATPNILVTKTLGPTKQTTQTDVEDTCTFDFMYDGATASGFYGALWTASRTGAALTVTIAGGGKDWEGEAVVTALSTEFAAEDFAACSASFVIPAGLTYATV
jgi:hypothetical protein